MAIYCGIDFHPRQHSVCYCDAADGEIHYQELHHEIDDFHGFYSAKRAIVAVARRLLLRARRMLLDRSEVG